MGLVLVADYTIDGVPVPQGSKSARIVTLRDKSLAAVLFDQNAKVLKPWRKHVTAATRAAYSGPRLEGPVTLELDFRFERPASVGPLERPYPTVKPDLDKLMRALLDGITDAGLWRDDAQVIKALVAKDYAAAPGVHVRIGETREREVLF